ncbi:MAG: SoxR reducing system RseC family protein [Gallionella sp.]|jgi:sigma-E factor negative regulatory protein RseC|nr:SoxR reducing system RseC family protein [Gallionella sp.]MCK9353289.1 SoxR reducing system RseC family protein [Gallionella sp.]
MIAAPVRVVSAGNGRAQVAPTEQSGCGGCQSRSSCGVSGLGKYFSGNRKTVEVMCDANVRAGDELQLHMSEGDLLKAGLLAYLLPTVLALVGAGVAATAGLGDVGAVLGAANGMAAGFLLGRWSGWTPQMSAQKM